MTDRRKLRLVRKKKQNTLCMYAEHEGEVEHRITHTSFSHVLLPPLAFPTALCSSFQLPGVTENHQAGRWHGLPAAVPNIWTDAPRYSLLQSDGHRQPDVTNNGLDEKEILS